MSSMIVNHTSMHVVVGACAVLASPLDDATRTVACGTAHEATMLGRKLLTMNISAFNKRYPNSPGDYCHAGTYEFEKPRGLSPMLAFKTLDFFMYQIDALDFFTYHIDACDKIVATPEYRALDVLRGRVACNIARETPAYDAAPWGVVNDAHVPVKAAPVPPPAPAPVPRAYAPQSVAPRKPAPVPSDADDGPF